jgi:hypothetical protein
VNKARDVQVQRLTIGNSYMKRTILAVAMLALFLPAARVAQGGVEVNFDFFYNSLSGGSWIEVADYGYCWQPDIVVSNTSWRPYTDGYWAYTDLGWTWVSYEDFGWATYHYGRWARLADYGWVWVPGKEEEMVWGPAWVSWRTGTNHIGWAPLPPDVVVYEGRSVTGRIDAEFDIGPGYYCFVDVRYIGEPVLRERIYEPSQNVTFIQQTVNVTNITVKNKIVYNYGPDYNFVSQRSARPVARLKLDLEQNVDPGVAVRGGGLMKVQGDKLVVAAPLAVKKSGQLPPPPKIKAKVQQAKIDKGWSVVQDPKVQTELKQKMKTEDPSKVLPPGAVSAGAQAGAGASTGGASPSASASAAGGANVTGGASPAGSPGASPFERGKGKGKHGEKADVMGAQTGSSPAGETSPAGAGAGLERGKGKHGGKADVTGAQLGGSPTGEASPAGAGTGLERGKGKGKRGDMPMTGGSPAGAGATTESSPAGTGMVPEGGKHKGKLDRANLGATPNPDESSRTNLNSSKSNIYKSTTPYPSVAPTGAGEGTMQPREQGLGKGRGRHLEQPTSTGAQGAQGIQPTEDVQGAAGAGRGRQKAKEVQPNYVAPAGGPAGGGPAATGAEGPAKGQGRGQGKKQQGEASPVPSPQ